MKSKVKGIRHHHQSSPPVLEWRRHVCHLCSEVSIGNEISILDWQVYEAFFSQIQWRSVNYLSNHLKCHRETSIILWDWNGHCYIDTHMKHTYIIEGGLCRFYVNKTTKIMNIHLKIQCTYDWVWDALHTFDCDIIVRHCVLHSCSLRSKIKNAKECQQHSFMDSEDHSMETGKIPTYYSPNANILRH
jgi:hypothetical protein